MSWKIGWRRSLFEWERNQKQQLVRLLEEKSLKVDRVDKWVWKESGTKDFTVKYAYKILKEEAQGDEVPVYECFWRIKTQPSSHFTA